MPFQGNKLGRSTFFLFLFFILLNANESRGATLELPDSIAEQALTEVAPFTFSPADFTAADYRLEWRGKPIAGVEFSLGKESLEWVRVSKVLMVPRGRVMVRAKNIQGGQLKNIGSYQGFKMGPKGSASAQIPVAMISGKENSVQVVILRGGREINGEIVIRFNPRKQNRGRILLDTSCSKFNVQTQDIKIPANSWVYLGCRLVYVQGDQHRTSSLDVYAFWDNVGQSIWVDKIRTQASSVSVWPLRLRSEPGRVKLRSSKASGGFEFTYRIAEHLHLFYLGLGLGPYQYTVEGAGGEDVSSIIPLATLYGSYFMSETMRLVFFDATAVHSEFFTDFGVYLLIEQVKALDARFSLNLLLGGHTLFFTRNGKSYFRFSGPQGVEVIFRDFLKRRHNIGLGAFIHPLIGGRSYANIWVRWGSSIFVEFNYIAWREQLDTGGIYNRSAGITVGFPLLQLL